MGINVKLFYEKNLIYDFYKIHNMRNILHAQLLCIITCECSVVVIFVNNLH